ncbi:MAG: TPR repeat protein [Paracoccaceae bacterium]|jgi:TPR repeat protein
MTFKILARILGMAAVLALVSGCASGPPAGTPSASVVADTRAAAEQEDADAQTYLVNKYHNGMGIPVDFAEAVKW